MSFVAAEIESQPDSWLRAATLAHMSEVANALPPADTRVAIVGCGTSLYMAQSCAALRERGQKALEPARKFGFGEHAAHQIGLDQRRGKNAQTFGGDCGTMINEIRPVRQALHGVDVAAVGFLELNAFGKIVEIAANHVVAADHLIATPNESVGEMAAEESGGAGDENLHELRMISSCFVTTSRTTLGVMPSMQCGVAKIHASKQGRQGMSSI